MINLTSDLNNSRNSGALNIWLVAALAAFVLLAAVLSLQVIEYLFYEEPPCVWPGSEATSVPQTAMKPLAADDTAVRTNAPLEKKTVESVPVVETKESNNKQDNP